MNSVTLSPINQAYIAKASDSTQQTSQKTNNKEKKTNKGFLIAGACITATAIAALAINGKLKSNKAKRLAQEAAEKIRKNKAAEKIFEDIKCLTDPMSETGQKMTLKEMFEKYLHDYPTNDIDFYHGTGAKSAESIKEIGFIRGWRGRAMGNFDGVFLTEKIDVAQGYANQRVGMPGFSFSPSEIEQEGAIVRAKIPNGKLAQFTTKDDKFLCWNLLQTIFEEKDMIEATSKEKLNITDVAEYLTEKLTNLGYDGIRTFDAHTGATPVIFNPEKIHIEEIIK